MKSVILTATGGGHLEQIKRLDGLRKKYKINYIVAKNDVNRTMKDVYFVPDYRNHRRFIKYFDMLGIFFKSFHLLRKLKPDVVISTGAASTYALCLLQKKIFHRKVIYIESFACRNEGTATGKKVYRFADHFVVQWEEMLKVYPNAICGGMIY